MDLKPYPAMKDSGVEWLGDLPEHWEVTAVKRRYAIRLGKMLQTNPNGPTDIEVPYLKAQHVQWFQVRTADAPRMWASANDSTQFGIARGDLLVCEGGEGGRCGIVKQQVDGYIIQNALHRVRPRRQNRNDYLQYMMSAVAATNWFAALNDKATIAHFTREKFSALRMPIPPVLEQTAIVRFLDHADRRIQRYIRAKQKLVTLLEEQKQALIHQAVTGQIDVCTGRPYPAYKPSGVEWLGDVPEHWEIRTLGRIAESFRTGPFGSMLHQSDYVEDGTPVINPIHMNNGVIVEDPSCSVPEAVAERLSGYRLGLHNLVFSRRGELGRCAIVRSREVGWLCGTGSIRVRIEYKRIVPKFLIQALQVRWVGEYLSLSSVGATMDNLNTGILKGVPLLVPPIQEQRDLLERIGQRTKTIDHAIRASKEEIRLIQEYRTRLIADVVTGKLNVREAVARLPDEAEEPELRDETDGFTDGEEEPSDDLDAAPEEAAV